MDPLWVRRHPPSRSVIGTARCPATLGREHEALILNITDIVRFAACGPHRILEVGADDLDVLRPSDAARVHAEVQEWGLSQNDS